MDILIYLTPMGYYKTIEAQNREEVPSGSDIVYEGTLEEAVDQGIIILTNEI